MNLIAALFSIRSDPIRSVWFAILIGCFILKIKKKFSFFFLLLLLLRWSLNNDSKENYKNRTTKPHQTRWSFLTDDDDHWLYQDDDDVDDDDDHQTFYFTINWCWSSKKRLPTPSLMRLRTFFLQHTGR